MNLLRAFAEHAITHELMNGSGPVIAESAGLLTAFPLGLFAASPRERTALAAPELTFVNPPQPKAQRTALRLTVGAFHSRHCLAPSFR